MKKASFFLAAMAALTLAAGTASAQPSNMCDFTGTAMISPGLPLVPASETYRFDGEIPSCYQGDCAGGVLVSIGTLSPGACWANQHSGVYAIVNASNPACNVGTTYGCPAESTDEFGNPIVVDSISGALLPGKTPGLCEAGVAGTMPCSNGQLCPDAASNALAGACAGAACAGRDGATNYMYAIVFDDERDVAVVEQCPEPPSTQGPVYFSGAIGF